MKKPTVTPIEGVIWWPSVAAVTPIEGVIWWPSVAVRGKVKENKKKVHTWVRDADASRTLGPCPSLPRVGPFPSFLNIIVSSINKT